MPEITVRYHHEGDTWWAESDDVAGFTAAADSLAEVRQEVREGLAFHLDVDPFDLGALFEVMAESDVVVASVSVTMSVVIGGDGWSGSPVSHTSSIPTDYRIMASSAPSPTLRKQLIA